MGSAIAEALASIVYDHVSVMLTFNKEVNFTICSAQDCSDSFIKVIICIPYSHRFSVPNDMTATSVQL